MNSRTKLWTVVCCALGAAGLGAFSTAVNAEGDAPSKIVRFSDLNMENPAGAKVLYSRIRAAAREVCELSTGTDPILRTATHACVESAIDAAVKKVNAPTLTALRFGSDAVRLASK
ncbi:MAG TPA: UrcA family protein [Steroidobacteraceae bacterium]|jgi:UrcA family protein|nr:UrcA family protein [Steroidobacteraceae bacterium]